MDWLLGSIEDAAERELGNYNPKTGKRKQDFGDWLGDAIFQRKSAIDKAVKDRYVGNIKDTYGTALNRYGSVVGGEDLSNLERLTGTQIAQRLTSNKELAGSRSAAGALTGDDISTFEDLNTPEAVTARASRIVRERKEIKENEAKEKEQNRYNDSIGWRRSQQEYLQNRDRIADKRYDTEQDRLWQDRQEGRKERALTRELNAENNAMQMQFQYAQLAQSERVRAQERKDKAIMALISGLGNLGAAFAI